MMSAIDALEDMPSVRFTTESGLPGFPRTDLAAVRTLLQRAAQAVDLLERMQRLESTLENVEATGPVPGEYTLELERAMEEVRRLRSLTASDGVRVLRTVTAELADRVAALEADSIAEQRSR
jgi:hypothetical protein